MSKLVLIGLATAALGIGGVTTLSSGKGSDVPSETVGTDYVAAAAQAQPIAAAVLGPFERSAELCATGQYECVTLGHNNTRVVTVLDMIPGINSWERVKMLNGWGDNEVAPDTVVQPGTTIAFGQRTPERQAMLDRLEAQLQGR